MENKKTFWENFIAWAIILAIVEIFVEDFSRLGGWAISGRKILILIGFLFDLIFTIEFTIRSFLAPKKKGWWNYFKNEKGWVDFVSSVPLILFSSGPLVIGMFFNGSMRSLAFVGIFNILKITKILRIARMLRLLRIVKVFKQDDVEAAEQRNNHVTKAITITIVAITTTLILSPLFPKIFYTMDHGLKTKQMAYSSLLQNWKKSIQTRDSKAIAYYKMKVKEDKNILYLFQGSNTVVNKIGNTDIIDFLKNHYFYTDYKTISSFGFKLYYTIQDVDQENARINLLIETIIVITILSLLIFYTDKSKA